ncbi:MAG: polysaccharide deacetylase family protein, partial [Gemmatimonadota bacterium]
MKGQPVVSLSLDLDDKWTYLKTHGDAAWSDYPSYLSYAVPRILDFLAARDVRITFFVVGRDATDERNREVLSLLARAGHEIASHRFEHDPWLHLYSKEQLHAELERA